MWWAQDKKSVVIQVWASRNRLEMEANRVGFSLPLEPEVVKSVDICRNGFLQDEGVVFDAVDVDAPSGTAVAKLEGQDLAIGGAVDAESDKSGMCGGSCMQWLTCGFCAPRVRPYEHLYSPYNADRRYLFKHDWDMQSPVDNVTAIQLIYSIIEAKRAFGGAGLNLDRGMGETIRGVVHFPAHYNRELDAIKAQWARCCGWVGPVRAVHAYWGTELAFYTAFLQHFAMALILPTIIGAVLYGNQLTEGGSPDGAGWTPIFGVLVALVCTIVFEQWRRQQSVHAMEWGTTDVASRESFRAEFLDDCTTKRSLVTGKPAFFPRHRIRRSCFRGVSVAVVSMAIGVVVVLVLSIFYIRVILGQLESDGGIAEGWSGNIAGIITAIQIQTMGYVYKSMARALTDFEAHRTDREYKNSLVAKITVFTFINDYYSLAWIAFVKPAGVVIYGEPQTCKLDAATGTPDCMGELQGQLATILITRLILGNLQELFLPVIIPRVMACFRYRRAKPEARAELDALAANRPYKPDVEVESELPAYDPSDDYLELFELFGYAYLFLPAWPLASFVALVSAFAEMYIDSAKLIHGTRRARPAAARDIGVWIYAFEAIAIIAIVSNIALIMFTSDTGFFDLSESASRLQVFIGLEHVLVGGVVIFKYVVPDMPGYARDHVSRQEYLIGKLLLDRNESVVVGNESKVIDVPTAQVLREREAAHEALMAEHLGEEGAREDGLALTEEDIQGVFVVPGLDGRPPRDDRCISFYDHGPIPAGVTAPDGYGTMTANPMTGSPRGNAV